MRTHVRRFVVFLFAVAGSIAPQFLYGQSAGNAGTIIGTVTDPSGRGHSGCDGLRQQPGKCLHPHRRHR